MSEERAAKIQRVIMEVYGKGNLDAMDELYDPQVIRHNPPYPDTHDLQAYKEYTYGVMKAWSDTQITLHEIISSEDRTAIRFTLTAAHTGETPLSHIPPTGKQVTQDGSIVVHWKGDKIVEEWLYADYVGLLQQIGVIPALTGTAR